MSAMILALPRMITYSGVKSCSTSTPILDLGRSFTWPTEACTVTSGPRYFLIVLALAGGFLAAAAGFWAAAAGFLAAAAGFLAALFLRLAAGFRALLDGFLPSTWTAAPSTSSPLPTLAVDFFLSLLVPAWGMSLPS